MVDPVRHLAELETPGLQAPGIRGVVYAGLSALPHCAGAFRRAEISAAPSPYVALDRARRRAHRDVFNDPHGRPLPSVRRSCALRDGDRRGRRWRARL